MSILFPQGQKSRGIKLFLAYIHDSKLKCYKNGRCYMIEFSFHTEVSNKRAD